MIKGMKLAFREHMNRREDGTARAYVTCILLPRPGTMSTTLIRGASR